VLIVKSPRNQTCEVSKSGEPASKIHAGEPVFTRVAGELQGRLTSPGLAACRRRPLSSNYKGFPVCQAKLGRDESRSDSFIDGTLDLSSQPVVTDLASSSGNLDASVLYRSCCSLAHAAWIRPRDSRGFEPARCRSG